MRIQMDNEVRERLAEYLAWVEAGAPDGPKFTRKYGLCSNIFGMSAALSEAAYEGLISNRDYPFGGKQLYYREHRRRTMHLNPARIAFVRANLPETEHA